MLRTVVNSESVVSVGHNAATLELEIELRNGRVYRYVGVPREIYRALMTAASKGSYVKEVVREGFLCELVV
jgi:KTSC domain